MRNEARKVYQKEPCDSSLHQAQALYEQFRYREAWDLLRNEPSIRTWQGVEAKVFGARLARHLGAPRLASRLLVEAWKQAPQDGDVRYYYGSHYLEQRGPIALMLAWREWGPVRQPTIKQQADLLSLESRLKLHCRDFKGAADLRKAALDLAPNDPWLQMEEALGLMQEDRLEEALELSQRLVATTQGGNYLPGIHTHCHLLQHAGRELEAAKILSSRKDQIQSSHAHFHHYSLLSSLEKWGEALEALDRLEKCSPLLERHLKHWLASQRAQVAYRLGDRFRAMIFAKEAGDSFNLEFAGRLENQGAEVTERIQLNVPFVRQHFKTCAPATFAALARYWGMETDHLKLVEEICYNGTPMWKQRKWAEENGWKARDFWVDEATVQALIRLGVPFALGTVEVGSSHLQAVVGFDQGRGTILVRDPSQPRAVEYPTEAFLKRYGGFGPQGTIFIPLSEAHRLDRLQLPQEGLCTLMNRVEAALGEFKREDACLALSEMARLDLESPVTRHAQLQLAGYDGDGPRLIAGLDRLLEKFPHSRPLQSWLLHCLRETQDTRYEGMLAQMTRQAQADPVVLIEQGCRLLDNAKHHAEAEKLLVRALKGSPTSSGAASALGELRWNQSRLEESSAFLKAAALLDGFREPFYQAWFSACRKTGTENEVLPVLEDRFRRYRGQSAQPGMTLAWAQLEKEDLKGALATLDSALQARADDGYLLLRRASVRSSYARDLAGAETDRIEARGKVREADWLRMSGQIAEDGFELEKALAHYQETLRLDPLSLEVHHGVTRCLHQLQGSEAALQHLRQTVGAHPAHVGTRRLLVHWTKLLDYGSLEVEILALLKLCPDDQNARQELAKILLESDRAPEALSEVEKALEKAPHSGANKRVLGEIQARMRQPEEARSTLRQAIQSNGDDAEAMHSLLKLSVNDQERAAELKYISEELLRQNIRGESLAAFSYLAQGVLSADTLLGSLTGIHRKRPDLWQAQCGLAQQLERMGRLEDALLILRDAVERFRHLPQVWLDYSRLQIQLGRTADGLDSLRKAFEMNPAAGWIAIEYAQALQKADRRKDAWEVVDRALRHAPRQAELLVERARLEWLEGDGGKAMASLETAIQLTPENDRAWSLLEQVALKRGEADRVVRWVRGMIQRRPGDAQLWLRLASLLLSPPHWVEALEAVTRCIELQPRLETAWDLKAELLARLGRFPEAQEACDAALIAIRHHRDLILGRKAWLEASSGRLEEAIAQMRGVVEHNQSYVWGWQMLAQWYAETGKVEEQRETLQKLGVLCPQNSWVSTQLAMLAWRKGDATTAKASLVWAVQVNPQDSTAASMLFDLHVEQRNFAAAKSLLAQMRENQPGVHVTVSEMVLHYVNGDKLDGKHAFARTLLSADLDRRTLDYALKISLAHLSQEVVLNTMAEMLRRPSCSVQVAAVWMQVTDPKNHPWLALWRFHRLPQGVFRDVAAPELLAGLATGRHGLAIRCLLRWQGSCMSATDAAWGQMGYALASLKMHKATIDWLADWKTRLQVQPWMVFNRCLALRELGKMDEARSELCAARQQFGERPGSEVLAPLLAFEEALAGNLDEAGKQLRRIPKEGLSLYDATLQVLAQTLIEVLQARPEGRAAAFQNCMPRLSELFALWKFSVPASVRDIRRSLLRAGKVLNQAGCGWRARLWFGIRWPVLW